MGVRGLTTFVENNGALLYKIDRLQDCSLVIDGNGLLYDLYFGMELEEITSQEYCKFSLVVVHFFEQLRSCNIKPYLIFDGPTSPDKFEHVRQTHEGNLHLIHAILYDDEPGAIWVPVLCRSVFAHVLSSLKIPYAYSLVDADVELAALANFLDCPLLAMDSDFFVFNLKSGYLPFKCFEWRDTFTGRGSHKYIRCKRYKISYFVAKYGVEESFVPFLAAILGNDCIPSETFSHLISTLFNTVWIDRNIPSKRVECVISWLVMHASNSELSDDVLLGQMRKSLAEKEQNDAMAKVTTSLAFYRDLPDMRETLKILKRTSGEESLDEVEKSSWNVDDAVKNGFLNYNAYTVIYLKYASLPSAIVCSTKGPSPYACATEIRNLFYRTVLRKYCLKENGPEVLTIAEYDRDGVSYTKVRGLKIFTDVCPACEDRHLVEEECLNMADNTLLPGFEHGRITCSKLISMLLRFEFERSFCAFYYQKGVPEFEDYISSDLTKTMDLVMLSTFYWFKKTKPKSIEVCSIILNIVLSLFFLSHSRSTTLKVDEKQKLKRSEATSEPESIYLGPTPLKKHPSKVGDVPVISEDEKHQSTSNLTPVCKEEKIESKSIIILDLLGPPKEDEIHVISVAMLDSAAKWLCTTYAVLTLHQAVEDDRLSLGLHKIFGSGLKLHSVHERLLRSPDFKRADQKDLRSARDVIAELLNATPSLRNMFCVVVDFLCQSK